MPLMEWSEGVATGFEPIDVQHQQLFNLMNELDYDVKVGRYPFSNIEIVMKLVHYFVEHFALEERFMLDYAYPGLDAQKQDHDLFIARVKSFKELANSKGGEISVDVFVFLRDWFLNHIVTLDKELAVFLIEHGAPRQSRMISM